MRRTALHAALFLCSACTTSTPQAEHTPSPVPGAPAARYYAYIANESSDVVSRISFTPGADPVVENKTTVGQMIGDLDGPHGLVVSPDAKYWYVSLAHGTPYGSVWKYATTADTLVGRVRLGLFPASLTISPDGQFLYVVNFNLHGDHVPSTVSIVHTASMAELARPVTCTMPHGSRLNAAGTKHYSTCMMDDELVELDTRSLAVSARFGVAPGDERELPLTTPAPHHATPACSPTWAQPGAGTRAHFIYVPCNKSNEILEIDVNAWRVTRRFPAARAPYNLAITPAGDRLLATLKGDQAVLIIDLESGKVVARIATTRPVTHGVVVTADGRFAFVTNEGRGSVRGTVDVIDLTTLRRVGSTQLELQSGGIDVWAGR